MTFHLVVVYSWKPFAASIPVSLTACTEKLTVEAQEKAVKKGRCPKGHSIDVQDLSANHPGASPPERTSLRAFPF